MDYPTNYEFLEMDLCSRMSELWFKGEMDEYFKVKQQKDIYNALLTLQLTDVIYKDEWRDKWTVR